MNLVKIKNITIFGGVSTVDKLLFTKYLAEMLKSGIAIDEAVVTARDQIKSKSFKSILSQIEGSIKNGQSLEKSLSKFPEVFDPFYLNLVRVGEHSGNLEENLGYLATQIKKSYAFKNRIMGAMLYPVLILLSTVISGGSLALFVLPQLVDLFKSLNTTLPLSTKILLFSAQMMKDYGLFIAGGVIGLMVLTTILLQTPFIKPKWHSFLLAIPWTGDLLQKMQLTILCRNMGLMLKGGMAILPALQTQHKATENLVYKGYLKRLIDAIENGKKLSEQMNTHGFKYLPAIFSKMIGVGENTGKLDETFVYLGDFFEEEVDEMTKNLSTIIEPVLLLIIGLVVGFVALAIISPIYQLTGSIKR